MKRILTTLIILLICVFTSTAQVSNKDVSICKNEDGNITLAVDNHKAYVVINSLNYNSFIKGFRESIERYNKATTYGDDIIVKRIRLCTGQFDWLGVMYDGCGMKVEFKLHKPMRNHGSLYLMIYDGSYIFNRFIDNEGYTSFLTKEDAIEVMNYIIKLHDE